MEAVEVIVSILIVHFRAKGELFRCISSIICSKPKTSFEIIVVDNDEEKTIRVELLQRFPHVRYIASSGNPGYGVGNNVGAAKARGEYLFVLNPDTCILRGTLDSLVTFMRTHKEAGIVAPVLLDEKKRIVPLQGARELTVLRGVVVLSFFNKLFPNNPVSRGYWFLPWDRKSVKEVDVVPGTAFFVRRDVFVKVGGFDERFFLYFEEHDLCRRVKRAGYTIYMIPMAKLVHYGAMSARYRSDTTSILAKSRFLYFRKHFGLASALLVEIFATLGRRSILRFLHRLYA